MRRNEYNDILNKENKKWVQKVIIIQTLRNSY